MGAPSIEAVSFVWARMEFLDRLLPKECRNMGSEH
jgi:hypothetical protein